MAKVTLYRTRFANGIIAEFLPPSHDSRKVVIISPGAPGYPGSKGDVMQLLANHGYWSIVPRYRGTWESEGTFLEHAPSDDIRVVMDDVEKGFDDLWSGTRHVIHEPEFYLLGGSFGGPAALLNSADTRVKSVATISGVTDWRDQQHTLEPLEEMKNYVPTAYGAAYRADPSIWEKLAGGNFYNPATDTSSLDGSKILLIHAKDDRVVHAYPAEALAKEVNAKLVLLPYGGHMGAGSASEPHIWRHIERHFRGK